MTQNKSRGHANLIIGVALVGLGALFLMGQIFDFNFWDLFWPFCVIIPGVMFFVGMVIGGKPAGPLAIPGSIVTTVGLLLLYQNIFEHWESWAYAWALIFPTSIGVGLVINGVWSGIPSLTQRGTRWASFGVILFLAAGAFFELVVNISGGNLIGNFVWPGLLILVGAYLLMRQGASKSGDNGHSDEALPTMIEVAPARKEPEAEQLEPEFEPLDMTRGKKGSE